jgi:hypothetical protein
VPRGVLCAVAVFGLVLCAVDSAPAAMISFRPAPIPHLEPPQPVPLAIDPPAPTTADTISFSAPLDGELYSNKGYAAKALLGSPVLDIDEGARVISIYFDGVFSDFVPEIYEPVLGASGEFGPLPAGDWTLNNSHGGSLHFTVVPEPVTLFFLGAGAAGLLAHGRRRRR